MVAHLSRRLLMVFFSCFLAGAAATGLLVGLGAGSAPGLAQPGLLPVRQPPLAMAASGSRQAGTALVRLTTDGLSTPVAWTTDGHSVLVQRPGRVIDGQQLSELWVLPASGGPGYMVSANALSPAVHRSQVAFLSFLGDARWQTVVADLAGTSSLPVAEARWNLPPTWVNDALVYLDASGEHIVPSAVPGSAKQAILPRPWAALLRAQRARLSADGQLVAVSDNQGIAVWSADGSVRIAQADQVWEFGWSPGGDKLAYIVTVGGPGPELWVWDRQSGQSWRLATGDLEHFGAPAWSPNGHMLAFARTPTGNGQDVTADIWLANVDRSDVPGDTNLHPLALTPSDEDAPCWAPNGRTLAFARNGDLWVADLDAPGLGTAWLTADAAGATPLVPTIGVQLSAQETGHDTAAPLALTAPLTIRVKHDARNTCRAVPVGQIDIYGLEDYTKRVVPHEVYVSWPEEALKAQAVAARTYAWRKALDRRAVPGQYDYDVLDSTADQYMCDQTYGRTDAAVDATAGQYVSYAGKVVYAYFCAETGTPTNYQQAFDLTKVPYLRPVDDRVSFGQVRKGHSWGMSQWGAYRWAAWHGWDYQQILCHYYSGADVERSSTFTQPLAGLVRPWPDLYATTDQIHLLANAADDGVAGQTGVLTVAFSARLTDTWTVVGVDTDASDGWGTVWPVLACSDTVTPSIELQLQVTDSVGQMAQSPVSHIGLDRTAPNGALAISSTEVTTLVASLSLTVSDSSPAGIPTRISLGYEDWVWEDRYLYYNGGEIVTDSAALDGSAWHVTAGTSAVLYGPYTAILTPGEQYRAFFRLRVPTEALTSPLELARLDVSRNLGAELLGVRYIAGTDFPVGNAYQERAVDFNFPASGGELEFRTSFSGPFDLWLDRVTIAAYPVEAAPTLTWPLPAREGPVTVTARFIDGADNISPPSALVLTVTDHTPPGDWWGFHCAGSTCAVLVHDSIAGLDVTSAAYRYSSDEGMTWSDWVTATCSGISGSHAWETVIATNVPVSFTSPLERIQYRLHDAASVPNEGISPACFLHRVYLPAIPRP